jgi:hypothetical protein
MSDDFLYFPGTYGEFPLVVRRNDIQAIRVDYQYKQWSYVHLYGTERPLRVGMTVKDALDLVRSYDAADSTDAQKIDTDIPF